MDNRLKVEECMERFVTEFVIVFEKYFSEYYLCLLRKMPKNGTWGRMVEGILSLARFEGRESVFKLERTIWIIGVLQKMVHSVGVHYDEEKLKKVSTILVELRREPHRIRETLLESASIIFQSFEKQFMQLESTTQNWCDFDKVVRDSVNRVIRYYKKNPGTPFNCTSITTALIFGESKHYHGNLSPRGYTVTMNKTSIKTKHLFERVGLKRGSVYCHHPDSKPELGYRLAFDWEHINNASDNTFPQDQYQYCVDEEMISRISRKVGEGIFAESEVGKFDEALQKICQEAERDVIKIWSLIENHSDEVLASLASLKEELREDAEDLDALEHERLIVEMYLERFVSEFVIIFEEYFSEYYLCLLRKTPKNSDWDKMAEGILSLARLVGGEPVFKLERTIWIIGVLQKMVHSVGVHYDEEKLKKVSTVLVELRREPHRIRETLLESASIIFQSFEKQFMQLDSTTQNWCDLDKVVRDSVYRVISYYKKNPGTPFNCTSITTALISGESKHYHGNLLPRGYTVMMNKTSISTKHLFERVVSKRNTGYCHHANSNPELGYRLAFDWEQIVDTCDYQDPHDEFQYRIDEEMISRITRKVEEDIHAGSDVGKFDGALQKICQEAERDVTRLWLLIKNNFKEVMECLAGLKEEMDRKCIQIREDIESLNGPGGVWFDLIPPTEFFVGREKELKDLHSKTLRHTNSVNVTAICGLGGMGKTEFARKYIYQQCIATPREFPHIIWLNAENEKSLLDSFLRFATQILHSKLPYTNENSRDFIVHDVYKFLSSRSTLIVIDNVENGKSLKHFLPLPFQCPSISIILISRNKEWSSEVATVNLSTLNHEDAMGLLVKTLKFRRINTSKLNEMVEVLNYFPLALSMAAAYIKGRSSNINTGIEVFLKKYRRVRDRGTFKALKSSETDPDDFAETTFNVGTVSLKAMKKEPDGDIAMNVLNVLAFVSLENIDLEIFSWNFVEYEGDSDSSSHITGGDLVLESAFNLLTKYAFVNGEDCQHTSAIRLLQEIMRLKMMQNEDAMFGTFDVLVSSLILPEDELDISVNRRLIPVLMRFLFHFNEMIISRLREPEKKQKVEGLLNFLNRMGKAYGSMGECAMMLELCEVANSITENYYGIIHYKMPQTLNELAKAHGTLGKLEEAKKCLEKALKIQGELYDDNTDHIEMTNTLNNLANIYGQLDEHKKMVEYLERVLLILEKPQLVNYHRVQVVLYNLGIAYGEQGNHRKQRDCLERALQITDFRGLMTAEDYLERARLVNNLGNAYGRLGDHLKQVELYEQALKIRMQLYEGEDHVEVARSLHNLGAANGDLGNHEKKKTLLERSLAIELRHYGNSGHIEIATTYYNLGIVWGKLGDHRRKKELLEKALEIEERHYGSENFKIVITLYNLAISYRDFGDYEKSRDLLMKTWNIQTKHFKKETIAVAKTLFSLGTVYNYLEDYINQVEVLKHTLEIQLMYYKQSDWQLADTLDSLGSAYGFLAEYHKQKDSYTKALGIRERHLGSNHREVAKTMNNIGNADYSLRNYREAKDKYDHALRIQEKLYKEDFIRISHILSNLGFCFYQLGVYEKAKRFLEKSLSMKIDNYGENHKETNKTKKNLERVNEHLNFQDDYRELPTMGPQIQKQGSIKHRSSFRNIPFGTRYIDKKKAMLETTLEIEEKTSKSSGLDHLDVAAVVYKLGVTYGELGKHERAIEFLERALKIQEDHYGDYCVEVSNTLIYLGEAYGHLGNHRKQRELLEKVLANQENYRVPIPKLASILDNLGSAYGFEGNSNKQKEVYNRSLVTKQKYYGVNHYEVAKTLNNLGNVCFHSKDYHSAIEKYERALIIEENLLQEGLIGIAHILNNLGCCFMHQGDIGEAKMCLEESLAIKEVQFKEDDIEVTRTIYNLRTVYYNLGYDKIPNTLLEKSSKMYDKYYKDDCSKGPRTLNKLAHLSDFLKTKNKCARTLKEREDNDESDYEVAMKLRHLGIGLEQAGDIDSAIKLDELANSTIAGYFDLPSYYHITYL